VENRTSATLLIVEDDLDIADMLNAYFNVQGYRVLTVNWGEDCLRLCQNELPDIIILDIRLPDLDGFEVARRLKNNRKTQDVPIIFLTELRHREDRLRGLSLGAEDYITKPFDFQELRLKIRNALLRHSRYAMMNAITGLPERQLFTENLDYHLSDGTFGLVVILVQNLDAFRDAFGFIAADEILRAVALIMKDSMIQNVDVDEALANWGRLNFVMTTPESKMDTFVADVQQRLSQSFTYFQSQREKTYLDSEPILGYKIHAWSIDPRKESLQKIINDLDHLTNQVNIENDNRSPNL
jgi:DNA-binding response OmpR family regulator